jgi:transposase
MLKESQIELPNDISALKKIINTITSKNSFLENRNEFLYEEIKLLRLKLYTRLSERFPDALDEIQRSLFEDWPQEVEEIEPEEESLVIKEHERKKSGRKPLPEDLPRVEVIHDISDEEKQCGCGATKSRIGEETSEKLQIEPAKLWVEEHIRPKYACKSCEGVDDDGKTVSIASVPSQIIPKSIAGSSLIAHIMVGKFCDALPFYRQEQQFKRYAVQISRATMCNWFFYVANRLKPLLEMLRLWILSGPLINIDETPVQVLKEPGRDPSSKSYMWVFRGGKPSKPGIFFHYSASRGGKIAEDFLGEFKGYIQTDGYQGYNFLDYNKNIIHSGCWAHVRRKFTDVINAAGKKNKGQYKGSSKANYALRKIRDLYLIEREVKDKNLEGEILYKLRQEKSVPIIKELEEWLKVTSPKVPPQCLLGKALNYALNQWPTLITYLDTSFVRMDNNLIENAIRPFAIGRKNWMFSVAPRGAESSALFYSLIETAKINGLEPYRYLKFLFEAFPKVKSPEDIFNLLPMNIDNPELKK